MSEQPEISSDKVHPTTFRRLLPFLKPYRLRIVIALVALFLAAAAALSMLLRQITPGMKAVVKPEQPIGGEHIASVTIVDQVIDPASGTFGIRLELKNPDYKIPAGLRCDVNFVFDEAILKVHRDIEN